MVVCASARDHILDEGKMVWHCGIARFIVALLRCKAGGGFGVSQNIPGRPPPKITSNKNDFVI